MLAADALHTWSDIWTTLVLLVGLAGALRFDLPWLDVALAIPVSLMLVKVCWGVLQENLPLLVDQIAIATGSDSFGGHGGARGAELP